MPDQNFKIRYDKITEILRPDPASAEDRFIVLRGLIGQSSEAEHVRIFLDSTLNVFIDVYEDDILYAAELSQQDSPIGGSLVWLNLNAVYTFGDPAKQHRPRETFLNGRLRLFLGRQAAAAWGGINNLEVEETEGFDVNCPDPPSLWCRTPGLPCAAVVSRPDLSPCYLGPVQLSGARVFRKRFNPQTGFEPFNPYDW
jgi:hypothetical protein